MTQLAGRTGRGPVEDLVADRIERLAVHPIHSNHPSTRKLGVVFREADVWQVCAGARKFHRAVEFLLVIGLLQEAGFHDIRIDKRLRAIHSAQAQKLGLLKSLLRRSEHRYAISARA